jgi:hypothetical protein
LKVNLIQAIVTNVLSLYHKTSNSGNYSAMMQCSSTRPKREE